MARIVMGESKGLFFAIGLLLSHISLKRAVLHAINNENALNLKDDDYRVHVRKLSDHELAIKASGGVIKKVLDGATAISSSLHGKFSNYVLLSPQLSQNNNEVIFTVENVTVNYRIERNDIQTLAPKKGVLRLDKRLINVWNYQTGTPHMIISGSTGSGKSQALAAYIAALATLKTQFKFIDPKNGELTELGSHKHIEVANDWDSSMRVMQEVIAILERRQSDATKNYHPLFLVIEEAAALLVMAPSNKDKQQYQQMLKRILVTARSANIHVISVMQIATADNIGGIELRAQYGVKILLGSPQQEELQFLFPAGTQATNMGKFAGLVYIEGQGVNRIQTPSQWAEVDDYVKIV